MTTQLEKHNIKLYIIQLPDIHNFAKFFNVLIPKVSSTVERGVAFTMGGLFW